MVIRPPADPPTMKLVYVAGPYSTGDMAANIRNAIDAADELVSAGFVPFCPHLFHFWHLIHPHGYDTWMMLDEAWLTVCDAVVRIPGESPGADHEVALAERTGIPVFYGVEGFLSPEAA